MSTGPYIRIRRFAAWTVVCAFWAVSSLWIPAEASLARATTREYMIKTAFLYNFGKFIHWPPSAFPTASAPFVLCATSREPLGDALDSLHDKQLQGRPLEVRIADSPDKARSCHILFISSDERKARQLLQALKGRSILTVGETGGFLRLGGIINFLIVENRVRFEINVDAARSANLQLSSNLLKLAHNVKAP